MHSILVVEDDLALSQGICLALDSGQLRFTTAATLHMARQCINSQQFDLVILDLNLPDGSGLDLLTSLRQTSQTAVILLTANDLETDVVTGFSLGCDDYITKPSAWPFCAPGWRRSFAAGPAPAASFKSGPTASTLPVWSFTAADNWWN